MKINMKKREFRVWGILSIVVMIVWLIIVAMIHKTHSNNKKSFLDVELKRFEGEINSTLLTYDAFSSYIFDEMIQDEEIMSIIDQANRGTVEEKEILREQLYNKLYNKYLRMQKYEFRQLHFHLSNTESFLRVHEPDKYGDLLSETRESVRLVNESKAKVTGFEEGKVFNGFRFVYPLEYNEDHVGSVEVSISSASIIEVLSKLYTSESFHFIIDKSTVKDSIFKEELTNYRDSYVFKDYYVDKQVDKITDVYNEFNSDSSKLFFKGFNEENSEQIKNKKSFSSIYKFEGKNYIVNFSSIKNTKQAPSAYLISISEYKVYSQFTKDMIKEITWVTLLTLFIIIFGLVLAFYQCRLKNSSELDSLTKIYNRNKFYAVVEKRSRNSKRYEYDSFVMLMDIDFFKKVNDTYGHEWGDEVLKALSNKILGNIRKIDAFARWGGEEFVLLLPNVEKSEALEMAEKTRRLIDDSESEELKGITISIGVSVVDFEKDDIDSSIKFADEAMYCAKENGRNQVYYLDGKDSK